MTDSRELPPSDFYAGMQLGIRIGLKQGRRDCLKEMSSNPVMRPATLSRFTERLRKPAAKATREPSRRGKAGK